VLNGLLPSQWLNALQKGDRQLYSLIEQIGGVFWLCDLATQQILYISSTYEDVWGCTREQLYADPEAFLAAVHPSDREAVRIAFQQQQQGKKCKIDYRLLLESGEIYWMRDRSLLLARTPYFLAIAEDITEAKQAELALKQSNRALEQEVRQLKAELERCRQQSQKRPVAQPARRQAPPSWVESTWVRQLLNAIDALGEGLTISDSHGKFSIFNRRMQEITGYSQEEANGCEDFLAKLYPDRHDYQIAMAGIEAVRQQGQCRNIETQICAKDGTLKTLLVSTSLIQAPDTDATLFASLYRDISDRKRTELALKLQTEQEGLLRMIAYRIRETLNLDDILKTAADAVRRFLKADRVVLQRFRTNGSIEVAVESLIPGWSSTLGWTFSHPGFSDRDIVQRYQGGYIYIVDDIYNANLNPAFISLLEYFQIRAQLVVPILYKTAHSTTEPYEQLWGLLVANQCSYSRQWQPLEASVLSQLAMHLGIAIEQAELYRKLERANQELEQQATLDGLTKIANRRRFDKYLQQEWQRLAREEKPLSLILCDVDYFKQYNDTYGHPEGDACLQKVARTLQGSVKRSADLAARYGGEEFAIVLPNTDLQGALHVSEAIQAKMRALHIPHRDSSIGEYVTLSFGVAETIPDPRQLSSRLVLAADRALYEAKALGRDRIVSDRLS